MILRGLMASMVIVLVGANARGGAVAVSRYSVVVATGEITGDEFLVRDEFAEFGPYDQSVGDSLSPAAGGTTSASASQQSDVDAAALSGSATGTGSAQVSEQDAILANAVSGFNFLFEISKRPEIITLDGEISSTPAVGVEVVVENEARDHFFFERTAGTTGIPSIDIDNDVVLQPGRYRLRIQTEVGGQPTLESARYQVNFAITNTPGSVVPLPAAVWPGAIVLAFALRYARAGVSFGKNFS